MNGISIGGHRAAANKGIAASRAGRCYLRLRFAISFGFGRITMVPPNLFFAIFS